METAVRNSPITGARTHWVPLLGAAFIGSLGLFGCGSSAEGEQPAEQDQQKVDNNGTESTRELSDVEGLRLCCLLGAGCHPEPTDPTGGVVRRCHELGHSNVPDDCRAQYDDCMVACNPTGMETEHACF